MSASHCATCRKAPVRRQGDRCTTCIAKAPYVAQRVWQFERDPSYQEQLEDLPQPLVVEQAMYMASEHADARDALALRETQEALLNAVRQLCERQLIVIALRYGEDMTLNEIGERLGVTGEMIRQVELRALGTLRVRATDIRAAHQGVLPPERVEVRAVTADEAARMERLRSLPFVRVVGVVETREHERTRTRDPHPNAPVHRMRKRVRALVDARSPVEEIPTWRARKPRSSVNPRSFPTSAIEEHW